VVKRKRAVLIWVKEDIYWRLKRCKLDKRLRSFEQTIDWLLHNAGYASFPPKREYL